MKGFLGSLPLRHLVLPGLLLSMMFHAAVASSSPTPVQTRAVIQVGLSTSLGDVIIEVYPEQAPQSVRHFLTLVDRGFYDNTSFYRSANPAVSPTFYDQQGKPLRLHLIQGGAGHTASPPDMGIVPHEDSELTGLAHEESTLAWVRGQPHATTEFFINLRANPALNANNPYHYPREDGKGYAVFGRVVEGMDVVSTIHQQATKSDINALPDFPRRLPLPLGDIAAMKLTPAQLEIFKGFEQIAKPVRIVRIKRLTQP